MEDSKLIELCIKQDQNAQEILYKRYAPKFFALILRYIPRKDDAEDVLVESFYKIFLKVQTYKKEGSFEGWMRKLVVNDCLMFLRKNKMITLEMEVIDQTKMIYQPLQEYELENIKRIIDSLPNGYKIIFNLYVVEGFKHKEIAELLGISVNTSKSQLIHAKRCIRKLLGLNEKDNYLPESEEEE